MLSVSSVEKWFTHIWGHRYHLVTVAKKKKKRERKRENWCRDNQRRAVKMDKEFLYENRLRNSILRSEKDKNCKGIYQRL